MWTTGATCEAPKAPCMEIQLRRGPFCLALAHASLPVGLNPLKRSWNGNRPNRQIHKQQPVFSPTWTKIFVERISHLNSLNKHLYVVSVYTHKHTKKTNDLTHESCPSGFPISFPAIAGFGSFHQVWKEHRWLGILNLTQVQQLTGSIEATHKFQLGNVVWEIMKTRF